jgi:3-oxoacyl-[acyl-carrier protein] reductase
MSLKGKVTIVTGASRGIGRAIALALAKNGAHIAAVARSVDLLKQLSQEIENEGGVALPIAANVTIESEVRSTIDQIMETFGRVDILVNNAGVLFTGPLPTFREQDMDFVFDTNVKGFFLCAKAVLPLMIERKAGQIINIASLSGLRGWAEDAPYTASKWAVFGFSESLDEEVRKHGIKVSCICPGSVATRMIDPWVPPEDPRRPLLLRPDDIANAVLFVATQPSNVVVNQLVVTSMVETFYSGYLPANQ